MKKDNINYFIVGLFVLITGILLLLVLFRLTDQSGPTDSYHVYYNNVGGIKYGTTVTYEGFQVGQVEDVEPERIENRVKYRVTLSINEGWLIPSDSIARIVSSGLISSRMIDIQEGHNDILLSPGAELLGEEQLDLFAAMGDVAADFHRLTTEGIEPTLNVFIDQVTRMTDTLETVASKNIQPFFETLQKNVSDPGIWDDARALLVALNQSADKMNTLLNDKNQENFAKTLNNFEGASSNIQLLTERVEHTRLEIHQAAQQLNQVITENSGSVSDTLSASRNSAEELRNSLTTVSEHINNVMYDLEGTMRNLHEFSRQIRENPRLLISSSAQDEKGE